MRMAIAGAVLVLGYALAAPAHAYPFSGPEGDHSASAFWVDISQFNRGGKVTVARSGQMAQEICDQLENGKSEGDIVAGVANGEDNGDTSDVGAYQFIVDAAEWHFCPAYY
jgi:hypothetical protein